MVLSRCMARSIRLVLFSLLARSSCVVLSCGLTRSFRMVHSRYLTRSLGMVHSGIMTRSAYVAHSRSLTRSLCLVLLSVLTRSPGMVHSLVLAKTLNLISTCLDLINPLPGQLAPVVIAVLPQPPRRPLQLISQVIQNRWQAEGQSQHNHDDESNCGHHRYTLSKAGPKTHLIHFDSLFSFPFCLVSSTVQIDSTKPPPSP